MTTLTSEHYVDLRANAGGKPARSALSDKAWSAGDIKIRLGSFVVGVSAADWARVPAVERQALKAEWRAQLNALPDPDAEPAAPDYAHMSLDDLKRLAAEREIDLSGRRTIASIAQALHAADAAARFADVSEPAAANEEQ